MSAPPSILDDRPLSHLRRHSGNERQVHCHRQVSTERGTFNRTCPHWVEPIRVQYFNGGVTPHRNRLRRIASEERLEVRQAIVARAVGRISLTSPALRSAPSEPGEVLPPLGEIGMVGDELDEDRTARVDRRAGFGGLSLDFAGI
jgi:hypothetical protein